MDQMIRLTHKALTNIFHNGYTIFHPTNNEWVMEFLSSLPVYDIIVIFALTVFALAVLMSVGDVLSWF